MVNTLVWSSALHKRVALGGWLLAMLTLTGCFDTKQEFTINPDGSGKVVHECRFDDLGSIWEDSVDSEKSLQQSVRKLIEESKGVDLWKDVKFRRLEDGRAYFRGTAYFRRLDALDIEDQMAMNFTWTARADGTKVLGRGKSKETSGSFDDLRSERNLPGTNASPADLAKYARDEQVKYRGMRPMLEQFLGRMKHEVSFNLPGKITKTSLFTSGSNGELKVVFAGTNVLVALDALLNDDELFKQSLATTNLAALQRDFSAEAGNELIFGKKALLQAVVSPSNRPLFDYTAEVEAAQSEFSKLQYELGMVLPAIAPAKEAAFKSLQVVGVRFMGAQIKAHNFGQWGPKPGLTLSLLAEFPGRVESLTENCVVESALGDDGVSVLPASASARKIETADWSSNRTAVLLRVSLGQPGETARALKELRGHVEIRSEAELREIDLGFDALRDGAKGSMFGASIKTIRRTWDDGQDQIDLNLSISLESLTAVHLVVDGARIPLKRAAAFGGRDSCQLSLLSKRSIPTRGRLVLEVPTKLQNFTVPFKLNNIPLPQLASELVK